MASNNSFSNHIPIPQNHTPRVKKHSIYLENPEREQRLQLERAKEEEIKRELVILNERKQVIIGEIGKEAEGTQKKHELVTELSLLLRRKRDLTGEKRDLTQLRELEKDLSLLNEQMHHISVELEKEAEGTQKKHGLLTKFSELNKKRRELKYQIRDLRHMEENSEQSNRNKYLKYKNKYLELKRLLANHN